MSLNDFLLKVSEFQGKLMKLPESFHIELKKTFKIVLVGGVGVGKGKLMKRIFDGVNKENIILTNKNTTLSNENIAINNEISYGYNGFIIKNRIFDVKIEFMKLPGLTSISRRSDQSENYSKMTSDLFDEQVPLADLIILCEPADRDIVNSESLKRVKDFQVDEKVILVTSKLDLLEEGTWIDEEILEEVAGSFSSIVAVRNSTNLESNESSIQAKQKEDEFFNNTHAKNTRNNMNISFGIDCLLTEIGKVLHVTFEKEKREILSKLSKEQSKLEQIYLKYQDPNFKSKLLIEFIEEVNGQICNDTIDGSCAMKIQMIFWKYLPEALDSLNILTGIDMKNLNILIKNSQGLRSSFNLENAFKILVKNQLLLSERVIFDCLQLVVRELKDVLIISEDFDEDLDGEDDQFYDVKSVSDCDSDSEYNAEDINTYFNHEYSEDKYISLKTDLKLIPNLVTTLNTRTSNLLSTLTAKTSQYLKDYCEMEKEMICCEEAEFIAAIEEYYYNSEDEMIRSVSNLSLSIATRNRSKSGSSILSDLSDDLPPLQPINPENNSSSFLKEFLALLLFPKPTKRVEYRPRPKLKEIALGKVPDYSDYSGYSGYRTSKAKEDVSTSEIEILLKLLKIYLKSHHNHLKTFIPKCIHYQLVSSLTKQLPELIFGTVINLKECGFKMMRCGGIEGVLKLIKEINDD